MMSSFLSERHDEKREESMKPVLHMNSPIGPVHLLQFKNTALPTFPLLPTHHSLNEFLSVKSPHSCAGVEESKVCSGSSFSSSGGAFTDSTSNSTSLTFAGGLLQDAAAHPRRSENVMRIMDLVPALIRSHARSMQCGTTDEASTYVDEEEITGRNCVTPLPAGAPASQEEACEEESDSVAAKEQEATADPDEALIRGEDVEEEEEERDYIPFDYDEEMEDCMTYFEDADELGDPEDSSGHSSSCTSGRSTPLNVLPCCRPEASALTSPSHPSHHSMQSNPRDSWFSTEGGVALSGHFPSVSLRSPHRPQPFADTLRLQQQERIVRDYHRQQMHAWVSSVEQDQLLSAQQWLLHKKLFLLEVARHVKRQERMYFSGTRNGEEALPASVSASCLQGEKSIAPRQQRMHADQLLSLAQEEVRKMEGLIAQRADWAPLTLEQQRLAPSSSDAFDGQKDEKACHFGLSMPSTSFSQDGPSNPCESFRNLNARSLPSPASRLHCHVLRLKNSEWMAQAPELENAMSRLMELHTLLLVPFTPLRCVAIEKLVADQHAAAAATGMKSPVLLPSADEDIVRRVHCHTSLGPMLEERYTRQRRIVQMLNANRLRGLDPFLPAPEDLYPYSSKQHHAQEALNVPGTPHAKAQLDSTATGTTAVSHHLALHPMPIKHNTVGLLRFLNTPQSSWEADGMSAEEKASGPEAEAGGVTCMLKPFCTALEAFDSEDEVEGSSPLESETEGDGEGEEVPSPDGQHTVKWRLPATKRACPISLSAPQDIGLAIPTSHCSSHHNSHPRRCHRALRPMRVARPPQRLQLLSLLTSPKSNRTTVSRFFAAADSLDERFHSTTPPESDDGVEVTSSPRSFSDVEDAETVGKGSETFRRSGKHRAVHHHRLTGEGGGGSRRRHRPEHRANNTSLLASSGPRHRRMNTTSFRPRLLFAQQEEHERRSTAEQPENEEEEEPVTLDLLSPASVDTAPFQSPCARETTPEYFCTLSPVCCSGEGESLASSFSASSSSPLTPELTVRRSANVALNLPSPCRSSRSKLPTNAYRFSSRRSRYPGHTADAASSTSVSTASGTRRPPSCGYPRQHTDTPRGLDDPTHYHQPCSHSLRFLDALRVDDDRAAAAVN